MDSSFRSAGGERWADVFDPPEDSWDSWNRGWAPPSNRNQTDVRYREPATVDLLGDDADDDGTLPDGGFFRGGDSLPVAATPGNTNQQTFSAGAQDPGELGLTPAQFGEQQRQAKASEQLETERLQRTAMLEEQAKQ